jgi:hypothetical protein
MKSGNLNFLEPSGPLQACNGIALPLPYRMKILLGDFNAKVGRKNIFKPTVGTESLHQDSNDNCVRIVNFATSNNLVTKSMMFLHGNIHTYT